MVSKKILLVAVCLAVVTAAVGVYAYNSINSTNTKTFYFESESSSQIVLVEDHFEVIETNETKTYHMKMTFAIKGGNLSIKAEIDDPVYYHGGFLGLVFDMNHSGAIEPREPAYMLYAYNASRDPVRYNTAHKSFETPYLDVVRVEPMEPSPLHTCFFNNKTDYTYKVQIPLEELKLTNDLVYMCCGAGSCAFYEEFHFGLEV